MILSHCFLVNDLLHCGEHGTCIALNQEGGEGFKMQLKVVAMEFNSVLGQFEDKEVKDFFKNKEVSSISDYFFTKNEVPYVALVIKYYQSNSDLAAPKMPPNQPDESCKKNLENTDMPLFNRLRDWRYNRSKAEAVPPYILCTNKQLVSIIQVKPRSLEALGKIEGIGPGKLEKYGKEILEIIATSQVSESVPNEKKNE